MICMLVRARRSVFSTRADSMQAVGRRPAKLEQTIEFAWTYTISGYFCERRGRDPRHPGSHRARCVHLEGRKAI
jgi:hypothetical protein